MQASVHAGSWIKILVAAVASGLLALPAGAEQTWQIMVNGDVGRPDAFVQYGPTIATDHDQPSLSGSAADGSGGFVSSAGNLATGELKVYSQSAGGVPLSQSGASVTMIDTIHIAGEIPFPMTATLIAGLNGTLVPSTWYETEACFGCTSAWASFQLLVDGFAGEFTQYGFQTAGCPPGGVVDGQSCINTTSFSMQVSMPLTITDTKRDFEIYTSLAAYTVAGGIADVSHTASLQLILPEELSFTSDSGVFLTAVAPVPEPGTWMLLGLGLAGLLVCTRRKREHRA